MSDTQSVSNFYVDHEGRERPIRYKAADLVNKLAPPGYHWERRTSWDKTQWSSNEAAMRDAGHYDCYICVRDGSPIPRDLRYDTVEDLEEVTRRRIAYFEGMGIARDSERMKALASIPVYPSVDML